MIVKLPIKINDKIQNQNFNVEYKNDKIIVTKQEVEYYFELFTQ